MPEESQSDVQDAFPTGVSMERLVVQLAVPGRWMLGRIYHLKRPQGARDPWCDYDEEDEEGVKDEGLDLQVQCDWEKERYVRGSDPMDDEGFDEASSFPSFKPDRDLFGPPRRCRKQRGWHYVKRWPPAMPSIAYLPQEEYATGADIPPELFNDIVNCFLKESGSDRRLGALRLVCRHWEKLCMGEFFDTQTLRNHEDVMNISAGLEKRREWGWPTYPIQTLLMKLDVTQSPPLWIHIVQTKLGSTLDALPVYSGNLTITGPLPAGRRLTSVCLSSPRRSLWHPLIVRTLRLHDLHFKKLHDPVRVLRELPFLGTVQGSGITWDSAPDVYPRARSFIPADMRQRLCYVTHYHFEDSPHLNAMLACALSPSGTPPITQPDTGLLCTLASTFACSRSQRSRETIAMCNGKVHVGLAPTQSRSQARTVQVIVVEDRSCEDPSVPTPWEIVADCVEKLVSRPNLVLVFPSLHSVSAFRQDVATPNMPRLVSQARLKYVVKQVETQGVKVPETWSLVEPDGDDRWRVLVTERPSLMLEIRSAIERVCELTARLPDH